MALVSVIIPSYNHAKYLGYALESVLAQVFSNWEAIVINDGSTDNTREVVAQFTDPRICYIYQKNQGLAAARNSGICAAQGKYLSFLDADDLWEPEFLERCVAALERDLTIAGVHTYTYFIDEEGRTLPTTGGCRTDTGLFADRILEGGFFPVHSVLVRTSIVHQVGLYDPKLTSLEDWDLWLRISKQHSIKDIPVPLVRYRVYPGSMSTDAACMHTNRIAVLTKYFGAPEGNPTDWAEEKRKAYGFVFRSSAFGYITEGQEDDGWRLLAQAITLYPKLLRRLDTFYELACGNQVKGYRGKANLLDISKNGMDMLVRLNDLFAHSTPNVISMRRIAFGNAYLALGMLSDQAGQWRSARSYLWRAINASPALLRDTKVVRRLLKLYAGKWFIGQLRRAQARISYQRRRED